ncbi:AAA family ATPase [Flavonifractor hominis]|uniref:AAA family ATPase n=1 Tax=Flavonifractor hominis TaxID=3133178 RepID=A0ABV1EUL2_9FIRM
MQDEATGLDRLARAMEHLDPAGLDYEDWLRVGMALKQAGGRPEDWAAWSRRDPARYRPGECERKWNSFRGSGHPVTAGTVLHMARRQGWREEEGQPPREGPAEELARYLRALFAPEERVGYVAECWQREGRWLPGRGRWDRTAGELIQALEHCGGDLERALGPLRREAGAWIRFNPLDGKGCKDENVTAFRYALVESDSMPIQRQYEAIRALQLPVACLVHSGGKSLHAIVRVDAADREEYRRRVDYLYEACRRGGLEVDRQNRNPSRLSRMPGVARGAGRQRLLATGLGQPSWQAWRAWMEAQKDGLPPFTREKPEGELEPLAPPLIQGVLRQGHKLLLAGPSKAGKSYALIQLCIAIAEGGSWLGFPCAQGRVLYVNLELDKRSCERRFADVRRALGLPCTHPVELWHLRGRSCPLDKLVDALLARARPGDYLAVVLDPIYKVITGDENAADQMAAFCGQFDRLCARLGCAVIYCHHHSKGSQGAKRSMDRASGSGVFARDPDALLDFIQLPVEELPGERAPAGRTAWRVEGTLREFPPFPPVDLWFEHPIHRPDREGVLAGLDPEGGRKHPGAGAARQRREQRRQSVEGAFAACAREGRTTVAELADHLGVTPKTVRSRLKEHGRFRVEGGVVERK